MSGTMDFFENQQQARRKTGLLVFYYVIAVVLIILGVYAAASVIFAFSGGPDEQVRLLSWDPGMFFAVSGATILVISLGTLYKVRQLSSGGSAVARLLGGVHVSPQTDNPKVRMLLNIVEEMAIASGVQVPEVYMLWNETAVNAFAAGFTQDDAVIGVTRGCLEELSREELQGVIAHEFSHILYGDMRINIKLMGVLHGILMIAFIGYGIMRTFVFSPRHRGGSYGRRSSGSGGGGGKGAGQMVILGLALLIIGSIGVFFGNLIKSAVSRQREFLADAAAVQFTRNPAGIAGALKKIGGIEQGSIVECKHAQEASHLFFSNSFSGFMGRLMSTHPPIRERIKRIEPAFAAMSGTDPRGEAADARAAGFAGTTHAGTSSVASDAPVAEEAVGPARFSVKTEDIVSSVGTTRPAHLEYAADVLRNIPEGLLSSARELAGAEGVVYAMLFSRDPGIREKQRVLLRDRTEPEVFFAVDDNARGVEALPVEYRLPLLDIAVSSLRKFSRVSYDRFKENVRALIEADGKVSLFEYTVHRVLLRHIEPVFTNPEEPKVLYKSLPPVRTQCGLLLSCLAHHGVEDDAKRASSFTKAAAELGQDVPGLVLMEEERCRFSDLDRALADLEHLAPMLKKKLLNACVTCVIADGWITVGQAELIRVTADAIGCPIPPLVPRKL